jgi:hypothetical protein
MYIKSYLSTINKPVKKYDILKEILNKIVE